MSDARIHKKILSRMDRHYFTLDQKEFNRFLAALDKTPTETRRLRRLLGSKPPWEQ